VTELNALSKHACPACGAQAEWSASKGLLVCPYCGTRSPYEIDEDSGEIVEIDLVRTLRELPEELRGWKAETRSVRCQSCKAVTVFSAARAAQRCDFCGSPEVVDYEEIKAPIRPQALLPFQVDSGKARDHLRGWLGGQWLAPNKLRSASLIDRVHGIYLPFWTFDAQVHCPWSAEAGHYYYTNSTYRDSKGKTRTTRNRQTRWVPASGTLDHFFDDVPVPGTTGVDHDLLRGIEPFPTTDLVPYDTAYLQGFVVEHYQIVLIEAARAARERMQDVLRSLCAGRVPGDTQRNLQISPEYAGETFKHILLPVWLLTYDYRARSFQVVVNGATGGIAGQYPKSGWKIFFLILTIAFAILLLFYFGR